MSKPLTLPLSSTKHLVRIPSTEEMRWAMIKDRCAGDLLGKRVADLRVGRGIDGGGGVVQNQDAGLFQQRTGNAEALLLAAGDVVAALLNVGLVLIGKRSINSSAQACFAGIFDLGVGSVGVAPSAGSRRSCR